MLPLSYQEEYSKRSFHELIRVLGEWNSETEIRLDKEAGTGTIQVLDIEEGLQIRIWDCTLATELSIDRQPSTNPADRTFTLVYYMTPGTFLLENCPTTPGTINNLWNTVFMTSDAEFRVRILKGMPMQCLSVNFTPGWLQKNIFSDTDFQDPFFQQKVVSPEPFVLFESVNHNEELVISNLFQNKYHASFGKFFFRSKALNLLTEFFIKMYGRFSSQQDAAQHYEQQMSEAEKRLLENLHAGLPDLKKIAAGLSINESTLKRLFKKIYGKNIYEYFLEQKMIRARVLLEERKRSVSEIAQLLGYDKVSQFVHMFKRFYGVQPTAYKHATVSTTAST
jgi:AraC-like DNA-binding protein